MPSSGTIKQVYEGPTFLNKRVKVATYSEITTRFPQLSPNNPPLNYGISFWVYLNTNQQASIGTTFPVFRYGIINMKLITGIGKDNAMNGARLTLNSGNVLLEIGTHENIKKHTVTIPMQKWSLVVFNVTGRTVDMFVDGSLVTTIVLSSLDIDPVLEDVIEVGGNNCQGAIQNISFSPLPLSRSTIVSMYNNSAWEYFLIPTLTVGG
jgi:hypothetical protein